MVCGFGLPVDHQVVLVTHRRQQPVAEVTAAITVADAALYESKRSGRDRVTSTSAGVAAT